MGLENHALPTPPLSVDARAELLRPLFAALPAPFNEAGYLHGRRWAPLVLRASGVSLHAELTPAQARVIAAHLAVFDWDAYLFEQRILGDADLDRHWRGAVIPGLTGYFEVCAEHGLHIVPT